MSISHPLAYRGASGGRSGATITTALAPWIVWWLNDLLVSIVVITAALVSHESLILSPVCAVCVLCGEHIICLVSFSVIAVFLVLLTTIVGSLVCYAVITASIYSGHRISLVLRDDQSIASFTVITTHWLCDWWSNHLLCLGWFHSISCCICGKDRISRFYCGYHIIHRVLCDDHSFS